MNVKPSEVLTEALRLIEAGWTRQYFARDIDGAMVDTKADEACRFCSLGAIDRARYNLNIFQCDVFPEKFFPEKYLREVIGFNDIIGWNDASKSKKSITNAFRKAIEKAKAYESQNKAKAHEG